MHLYISDTGGPPIAIIAGSCVAAVIVGVGFGVGITFLVMRLRKRRQTKEKKGNDAYEGLDMATISPPPSYDSIQQPPPVPPVYETIENPGASGTPASVTVGEQQQPTGKVCVVIVVYCNLCRP